MKLIYYQHRPNFGDALNPFVFEKILPGFFDDDVSTVVLGIGSIIHFKVPDAKRTIVFSSGYGYGKVPLIDNSYDIVCVRGPLTTQKLNLDKRLAVTDGAALLRTFKWVTKEKKYKCSFIPHHETPSYYDWRSICEEAGYHYIDPLDNIFNVIAQIQESELIIAEAMHGAIVADTFRVPWVPVKLYSTINEFKWRDWTASLNMEYHPNFLSPLFSKSIFEKKIAARVNNKFPAILTRSVATGLHLYQGVISGSIVKKFSGLQYAKSYLSNEALLNSKVEHLMLKTQEIKKHHFHTLNGL